MYIKNAISNNTIGEADLVIQYYLVSDVCK